MTNAAPSPSILPARGRSDATSPPARSEEFWSVPIDEGDVWTIDDEPPHRLVVGQFG